MLSVWRRPLRTEGRALTGLSTTVLGGAKRSLHFACEDGTPQPL